MRTGHDRPLRRMEESAGDVFCRRRRVRSDLPAALNDAAVVDGTPAEHHSRLRADARLHDLLPVAGRADSALRNVLRDVENRLARVLARRPHPARVGGVRLELRRRSDRRDAQLRVRYADRVGAGALRFPVQAHPRRARRSAVRAPHGGRGNRADHALRARTAGSARRSRRPAFTLRLRGWASSSR